MTKKKKKPLGHALLVITGKSKHYIRGVLVCSKVFRNDDDDMSLSKVHEALGDESAGRIKPIFTKGELEAAEAEALQYQTAMTG